MTMENFIDEEIRNLIRERAESQEVENKFLQRYAASVYPKVEVYKHALLCCAVRNGHVPLVKKLLEDDYNVNMASGPATSRPLHIACSLGDEELICILLNHGADVNLNGLYDTGHGEVVGTAVEAVLRHDDVKLLNLVSPGYDVNKSRGLWTLTHLACKAGALRCLKHVLNATEVNALDSKLRTPLYYAMHHNRHFVQLLLYHGAKVDIRDREGWGLMYPLLRRFSSAGPDFISHDAPAIMEKLVKAGMSLRETNQGESSFRMLCRQISAELLYRNDFNYPYPIETHQVIVKLIAKRLINDTPLKPKESIQCLNYILTSEVGKCCHSFPYWLVNTHHANLDKAFSSYCYALCLGKDLISLFLNKLDNNIASVIPEKLPKEHFHEFCSWLQSNHKIIEVVPDHDWTLVRDCLLEIMRLVILQLWTMPKEPITIGPLTAKPVDYILELPILELLSNISPRQQYQALVQTVRNETSESVVRTLMAECRVVILNSINLPRLQHISCLPLPNQLKNYVSLQGFAN